MRLRNQGLQVRILPSALGLTSTVTSTVRELCQRMIREAHAFRRGPRALRPLRCVLSSSRRVRYASLSEAVFRKARQLWYVQIDGRQINLGPDRDAAFTQYHSLMAAPKVAAPLIATSTAQLVVVLCDRFLDGVQLDRSAATYQWVLVATAKLCPPLSRAHRGGASPLSRSGMGRRP